MNGKEMNEKEMTGDDLYSRFWKACALHGRDHVFWIGAFHDTPKCAEKQTPLRGDLVTFEVRAPKLYTVSVEIPEPLKEFPDDGEQTVFVVDLLSIGGWQEVYPNADNSASRWLELGLCYGDRHAAMTAVAAMLERRRGEK